MTTLLVASTGGHLAQLHQLHRRLVAPGERVIWATAETKQSRSLLQGAQTEYVRYVGPRDFLNIVRNVPKAARILRQERPDSLYTTGAGLALAFVPLALFFGVRCHYIESAARSHGPSVTGRIMAAMPGVRTYCQYKSWSSDRWQYMVSVFDDFSVGKSHRSHAGPLRVVVTLGTIDYDFSGLVSRLLSLLPPDADVLWQTGATDVAELGIDAVPWLPYEELAAAMQRADLVVAHSGIGSALAALEAGKVPVLVPRRAQRHEHVDDHQEQIAGELASRGLAVYAELPDLRREHLDAAASKFVSRRSSPNESDQPH